MSSHGNWLATTKSPFEAHFIKGGDSELIGKNAVKVEFHISDDHGLQTLQYRKIEISSANPLPIYSHRSSRRGA
jgi:hypothetical protein